MRYVDDMPASKATMEELKQLVRDAEIVFKKVKISCKGWTPSRRMSSRHCAQVAT